MGGTKGYNEQVSLITGSQKKANERLLKESGDLLKQSYKSLGKKGDITKSPLYQQGLERIQNIIGQYSPDQINKTFEAQIGDPTRQQFQQQVVPNLIEGMIAGGASRSSGAQQQLAQAGQGLEAILASQRAGFQQQGLQNQLATIIQGLEYQQSPINQLMQLAQLSTGGIGQGTSLKQFENVYHPPQQSPLAPILGAGLSMLGGGVGAGLLGGLSGVLGGRGFGGGFGGGINQFLGR